MIGLEEQVLAVAANRVILAMLCFLKYSCVKSKIVVVFVVVVDNRSQLAVVELDESVEACD